MSEEIDARLLKGALATVHKALEATGFDDSQALDLYAPISVPVMREDPGIAESAPTEPDDNGSTVVAFTGSLAGEDSGDSHSASIGTETGPDEAVAQDEQANTNETAAELFGSMPWESSGPGESSSATDAVTKTASTDNCNVQISLDESAEKLFSSSKWGTAKPGASSEQIADAANPPDNGGSKTGLLPEETAEELFAAMPWEPNEASSSPATSKAPNQSGTEGGENKAGAFLLDMPWEESTEPADEGATHAQSKHATKSGSEETAAQDFFENLDWDGTPKPAENASSEQYRKRQKRNCATNTYLLTRATAKRLRNMFSGSWACANRSRCRLQPTTRSDAANYRTIAIRQMSTIHSPETIHEHQRCLYAE